MDGDDRKLDLPYYYGEQPEQFSFYRIPKALFSSPFKGLSLEAKFLYGRMLDRMELSMINNWRDKQGRVYIYYTVENVQEALDCQNQKATKLLYELEQFGLIRRKRQGQGKPTIIYVKDFTAVLRKSHVKTCENHDSGIMKIMSPESLKSLSNYTDINNTDISNIESILSISSTDGNDANEDHEIIGIRKIEKMDGTDGSEGIDEYEACRKYFEDHLDFDILLYDYPFERDMLHEILDLLVETVCTGQQTIRIGREDKPAQVVKGQLMKLTSNHIRYVLDCMNENTTRVRNIRQYLLTTLYNATMTISSYYKARVNHDMNGGQD